MALTWVSTGVDEYGNETGYNIDNGTGDVWDSSGAQLDPATADPINYADTGYDPATDNWAAWDAATAQYLQDNPDLISQDTTGSISSAITKFLTSAGQGALDKLKATYTKKDAAGNDVVDWKAVAATAGGLYGLYQTQQQQNQPKTGYQGNIPHYAAVRSQVEGTNDPARRAGSGGQDYMTQTRYASAADIPAAAAATKEEAVGLKAKNLANPSREPKKMAVGGIANLARGRYLGGASDGMADKIPASIDGKQEAKLSHGEFVVSADVVSALGGGNSESGAQRLYDMMDRVRTAAHGKKQQMKPVNPKKVLPV